ncbi:hypothetical protein ACGF0D_22540 [Kitasatospora sp. NPDC048298]|uniref:hypothetical protein n=1 Tax=Kitasatospora sp. NPDC048298 TaxID=3364049 RepID=UPI00371884DF
MDGTVTRDTDTLRAVLDRWKDAVDRYQPELVAAQFTEDAIFQGLHPYSVGRPGITAYYASQPLGMTADYRILETRRLADHLVLGYLAATFAFTDRPDLDVNLGILLHRTGTDWAIAHYQVSRLP